MLWDDYFNNLMVLYPNLSTFVGLHKYDNAFENDISNHHINLTRQFLKDYLNKAKVLKKNLKSKNILNKQSLFYTNILISTLKDSLNILKYKFNLLPLNQVNNEIIDFVEQATGDSFFRFNEKCLNPGFKEVIPYFEGKEGDTGIVKGKWQKGIEPLFDNLNIDIDFSKRGYYQTKNPLMKKIDTLLKIIKYPKQLIRAFFH